MRFKKIIAVMLTVLTCMMILPLGASAAEAKGIKLDKTKITMTEGTTYTLQKTVTGIKKGTLQWKSSNTSVATVSKGVVTAKSAGTATISVAIKGTEYKAECKVTVNKKTSGPSSSGSSNKKYSSQEAADLINNITIGWNLGNTLDSANCTWLSNDLDYETGWGNPKTTKAMITAVKKAGFNTVRIPVSWGDHMDANGKINTEWMDRVQEVVNYAYDNDMYVILNTHHELSWIKLDEKNSAASIKKFAYVWKQIAARFKDYDQRLIFEGLNEPRTEGSAKEWTGGTSSEWKILNKFYPAFIETVRASGGNNKTRLLIVTPYAANSGYSSMSALEIPDDDMIAVSVHAYLPYNVALNRSSKETKLTDSNKKEIDTAFSNIDKVFLSKGIPVIMDEFGAINKSNTSERVEIAKYYLSVAESYGVPCCWWDNGSNCSPSDGEGLGLLNRNTLKWYYPEVVKALVDSVK